MPSGAMLMSQGARSAGVIGCPNLGASATLRPSVSAVANASISCIDMAHPALVIDSPARDGVAVLHRECRHVRRTPGRAALGNECFSRRLHVAGFVRRTALQDRSATIPVPRNTEASECFAQNRRLQRRLRPALATVGRDLDFADAAIPGKGNAGDLVEAGPLHVQSRRRVSDEGFDLLAEAELPRFSVRPYDRVLLGFVDG